MAKAHHTAICCRDIEAGLRSVFLGDPADAPTTGFFLTSVYCDVDAVLTRLARLGLGGKPRRTTLHGVNMAVMTDLAGVRVELIDLP